MAAADKLSSTLSTRGQVTLPKAIRQKRGWGAGTKLLVENTSEGVLLKAVSVFPKTRPDEVFASLPHSGAPKSVEDMHAGIVAEARRRHARN